MKAKTCFVLYLKMIKEKNVNFQTTEKRRLKLPKMEIFFVLKNTIKLDQFGQNWTKVNIMMFALDLFGTLEVGKIR